MSQIQSIGYKLKKFWPSRLMVAARYYSSEHDQHSSPVEGSGLPPWIKVPPLYENPNLLKTLEADATDFQAACEPKVLKDLFELKVKPFLIPRGLLVEQPIQHRDLKRIHLMNKALIGHNPLYTTAIGLMYRMVSLHEEHQKHLLEMLSSKRVLVFEDWVHKLAPIECLFLDHGTQLASADKCTHKAECDASFHSKSQTATLTSVVWELGKLLDVQVNWGMACGSSGEAEFYAAYSVLTRGKDLKDSTGANLIKKIEIVTDREDNYRVLAGIMDPDPKKHSRVFMACQQVAKQYDVCKFRWAPRETVPLVDELSRSNYQQTVDVEEVIQHHSSNLWGCPIFRINATKNQELSEAIYGLAKRVKRKDINFPKCAFIRAEGYKEKLDALAGLLSVLNGCFAIVLVDSYQSATKIKDALKKYDCFILDMNHTNGSSTFLDRCLDNNFSALILVNESSIPPFAAKKALLVVFDKPKDPISYCQSQDTSGVVTITFGTHSDKNVKQVDPTLYGFFHSYEPYEKPQETFSIMTYNLHCKDDGNLRERFFALTDVVQLYNPDFICFQSITPKLHTQLQKYGWWREYFCSVHLPNVGEASNYLIQMSKLPATFRSIPCSTMKEFSTAAITMKGGRNLLLATCSLEGKCPTKVLQAQEIFGKLSEVELQEFKGHHNVMLCGGMNWDDKLDGRLPLPDGWSDAWEDLRKDDGFTCQLSGSPARGARILCSVPGYNIDKIDLVGKGSSPTISEHLGLVMSISHKLK